MFIFSKFRRNVVAIAIVMAVAAICILGAVLFWLRQRAKIHSVATYVGQQSCADCHPAQFEAWRASHHAQATQIADHLTVLGNFNGARFAQDRIAFDFLRNDGKFYVRMNGPGGEVDNYNLPYTLGVYPLQQYLASFPGGRMQSLNVAWDSRGEKAGGQHWFDLDPQDSKTLNAGRGQTWNSICADCHSTNVRKNYNLAGDAYTTTWSEINVSCEACHGPGSNHIAWAKSHKPGSRDSSGNHGLVVDLRPARGSWSSFEAWKLQTRQWQGDTRSGNEINICAPCHSRRKLISDEPKPGQPFLDAYVPSLLEEGAYYADGQILNADYEWGSFVQSKMYQKGVTCSDCHDPHSGRLPNGSPNALCGKCHPLANFGSEQHHHHKANAAGALCVGCHMPAQPFMIVGVNHDHSFRVPRPDLSVSNGTPNACTQCHRDKSSSWAAETIVKWYGSSRRQESQPVKALDAGRRGLPHAEQLLTAVITDPDMPAIVRATALNLLPRYLSPFSFPTLEPSLVDDDPLVRREAVRALTPLNQRDRIRLAAPLLTDRIRSVRIEAARLLAGTPPDSLQAAQKSALDRAISELIASEMVSADHPESHTNLARLYSRLGRTGEEETELRTALRLDPAYVPAMVDLADLYRTQNRDDEGQWLLEKAIAVAPNAAEPVFSLALLKIRRKQYPEVLPLLAKAATLQPDNLGYSYVYAVALNSGGHTDQAITVLQQAHQRRPADRQMLIGLITFERDRANLSAATAYARQLLELAPNDRTAQTTLSDLMAASNPKNYQYWLVQGNAELKLGHLAAARAAFQKGMQLATAELAGTLQSADAHVFIAYFAARLGDRARAEREIQQALELSADDNIIRTAVVTYEALGERERSIEILSHSTPQFLYELNRLPDLPELRDDPRFQQLLSGTMKPK